MECPIVKGVYTIAMTSHGEVRQWCPNCRDWHGIYGKPTKPGETGSEEKSDK
jgi:hypothetical protein